MHRNDPAQHHKTGYQICEFYKSNYSNPYPQPCRHMQSRKHFYQNCCDKDTIGNRIKLCPE